MQMSVAITIFLPTATSTATATFYGVGSFEWSGVECNRTLQWSRKLLVASLLVRFGVANEVEVNLLKH